MYQIIYKLLSPHCGRIYTVWGQNGVGKTALVKAVMNYVGERNLIKGGFFYVQANGITNCEIFLRRMNLQLVKENPQLFGPCKDYFEGKNIDVLSIFRLILNTINQLAEMVVFVIDSCDNLIEKDKYAFKHLIRLILSDISQSNIVLTTTMRIKDSNEELIVVDGLAPRHALNLFNNNANRIISIRETDALMKLKPDASKYPHLKNDKPDKLYDHHLFKLIGGNPQSILLIAPMLNDPNKSLTLVELYKELTSEKINTILSNENIKSDQQQMTASMRMSIETAF